MSPALQEIERRHLTREQSYDNLEPVPPGESVEWASPADFVPKPGEVRFPCLVVCLCVCSFVCLLLCLLFMCMYVCMCVLCVSS